MGELNGNVIKNNCPVGCILKEVSMVICGELLDGTYNKGWRTQSWGYRMSGEIVSVKEGNRRIITILSEKLFGCQDYRRG